MSRGTDSILSVSRALLLDRNVRAIALTSLISGVYIGMLNTLLQPFTVGLGLGIATLGILQALGNRFSGLASSLIQSLAGHYADIFGRKVVIVAGSVTTMVSMTFFLLAALSRNPVPLLVAYVLYGLSVLSSPASQAMVAESVNLEASKMQVAFSTVFLLGTASGAIMSFAAGPLVDSVGYFAIFGISVATWVPAQQSLLMARSPAGERGSLGGKLAVYRGLVAFPAPIIGGFLYQALGFRAPIIASLLATIITLVMIVKLLPDSRVDASGGVGAWQPGAQ